MNIKIKDGTVTNDGEEIGVIEGSTCNLLAALPPAFKGAINSVFGSKLKFHVVGASFEDGPEGEDGITDDAPTPSSPLEPTHRPKPPRNPELGDKCPLLVAWKEGK